MPATIAAPRPRAQTQRAPKRFKPQTLSEFLSSRNTSSSTIQSSLCVDDGHSSVECESEWKVDLERGSAGESVREDRVGFEGLSVPPWHYKRRERVKVSVDLREGEMDGGERAQERLKDDHTATESAANDNDRAGQGNLTLPSL